jgi:hypothetical protein
MSFVHRSSVCAVGLVTLVACGRPPSTAPGPREPLSVAASFGKTWDAAIDAFADHGISVETLDRSSGFIVPAGRSRVADDPAEAVRYADCGKGTLGGQRYPLAVKYNVLIRGDSTRSRVQVRAFYTAEKGEQCTSTGMWEDFVENGIKERAEGTRDKQ